MLRMVVGSVSSLFWCIVMLLCTLYIWSILIMQLLLLNLEGAFDINTANDEGETLKTMFSTVRRTSITLFQATSSGIDWGEVYELLSPHGGLLSALFVAYVVFFVVVAWNIVTSLFIQKALTLSKPDREELTFDLLRDRMRCAKELTELFNKLDDNEDGYISFDELRHLDKNENAELRDWLEVRNIRVHDLEQFGEIIQSMHEDSSGSCDIKTLVSACLHMQGHASGVDIQSLSYDVQRLQKMVYKIHGQIDKSIPRFESSATLGTGRGSEGIGRDQFSI